MNTKKRLSFLSTLVIVTICVSIEGTAKADESLEISTIEETQRIDKETDFKEDRDKAKEWADKEFEQWKKELKKDQVEAFKEVQSIISNG